ncbi:MAG: TonB-dependent receptor [Saprospiraceae bacterium]|nr:TonB-dependent receptor [Saprospiraceae bacterium]
MTNPSLKSATAGIVPMLCLLCFLCLPSLTAEAQETAAAEAPLRNGTGEISGGIEGVVRDADSGELLPLVNIRIVNMLTGTSSELDGSFRLTELPPGRYALSASYVGYGDFLIENIEVIAGRNTRVDFALQSGAVVAGEVVVTAGARSQAIKLAAASIGVITAQQIRERQITTFDQAFDEMPGVAVIRSGGANVQAFSIRGASEVAGGGIGNRVLLLIDGRPSLSPESGGALWNLVPLNSIERIEVVRGAYSSLYGSSAMGGVVNVITRKPTAAPETRLHLNYGAYNAAPRSAEYSRYNDFHTVELSHSRRLKNFSYLLDGSWKQDDGHKEKSGFDLYNFFGKTAWEFKPNHLLQISANANRMYSDAPATWFSRRQAYSVADFKKDDYQDRREFNADLFFSAMPNDRLKYTSRLYHYRNFSQFSFDDNPGNDSTNVNIGKQIVQEYSVRTHRLGNISQVDLFAGDHHYLIAGMDLKSDYVLGVPDIYLYGEHRVFSAGFYVQYEITIGEKLTATAGARFDHYNIIGEVRESNFSPKLALLYKAGPKLSLRTLLAQAFRDPPIAERFIKFEQGGGLRFQPNPGLRPERLTLSAELGAKFDPAPGLSIDAALFYNRYNNLISFQQLSAPLEPLLYQVVNLKEALMQGFEISLRRQWNNWLTMNVAYTYLDARDTSPERINNELAYKVRHTLGMSATASRDKWVLNLNSRYRSRIEEVFIYPGSEPDAVLLFNAKLSFKPSEKRSVYFAVNNIGNAQYEELERYRMPGRSFTTGLELSF